MEPMRTSQKLTAALTLQKGSPILNVLRGPVGRSKARAWVSIGRTLPNGPQSHESAAPFRPKYIPNIVTWNLWVNGRSRLGDVEYWPLAEKSPQQADVV